MKSDPSVEQAFAEVTGALPGIEGRKMFGYPAVFSTCKKQEKQAAGAN
jgi:hypothetical protein